MNPTVHSQLKTEKSGAETPKMNAQREKNQAARRLIQEWLMEESGYDEAIWPTVKQAIEENRTSYRKHFDE